MRSYTVKQLAELSGVSVRTLHHYDQIGLLEPAYVGDNGYRYYTETELLTLQQILLHRELGFALRDIAAILHAPGFDRLAALAAQKARLEAEAERFRRLVRTIDRTIAQLEEREALGESKMQHADLYDGFAPQKQEEYERWLVERYGPDMQERIDRSKKRFQQLADEEKQRIMQQLAEIEADLAESCRRKIPVDAAALAPVLERHRGWVAYMWDRPCSPAAYAGLADLYLSHPDFRARYERLAPGFCEYLAAAMKAHAGSG
jgi:MerR family transcriptional regulator, thiopeptide resistance regulator